MCVLAGGGGGETGLCSSPFNPPVGRVWGLDSWSCFAPFLHKVHPNSPGKLQSLAVQKLAPDPQFGKHCPCGLLHCTPSLPSQCSAWGGAKAPVP